MVCYMSDKYRLWSLRVPEEFPKRVKMAAVEAGMPMGAFLDSLLDDRDRRLEKARRLQPSPLHRVTVDE